MNESSKKHIKSKIRVFPKNNIVQTKNKGRYLAIKLHFPENYFSEGIS